MLRAIGIAVAVLLVLGLVALAYVRVTGLRANVEPGRTETRVARALRGLAVSAADRDRPNAVPASAEAIAGGLAHFADHCAVCHANDGSGDTDFGRGMYPPPPDLRQETTQQLTDGELFYIIENGIRFTGMPGFGTRGAEGAEGDAAHEGHGSGEDSWRLVHFIRHLPEISDAELERMEELNPRSPEEIRQEIEEERFLRGES